MTQVYSYDRQLLKDFIRYLSDHHKAGIVEFPDEFAAHQYINYRFINTVEVVEKFLDYKEDEE